MVEEGLEVEEGGCDDDVVVVVVLLVVTVAVAAAAVLGSLDEVGGGKWDGNEARMRISRTRQSFPPLYESDSSSGLFAKLLVSYYLAQRAPLGIS